MRSRPLARLAWRDARRARGRTALVLAMIFTPVFLVTVGTSLVYEKLSGGGGSYTYARSYLDTAGAAKGVITAATGRVVQDDQCGGCYESRGNLPLSRQLRAADDVREVLGSTSTVTQVSTARLFVDDGDRGRVKTLGTTDFASSLATTAFRPTSGRLPDQMDEVLAVRPSSYRVGDTLTLADGQELTVVGLTDRDTWGELYAELWGMPPVLTAAPEDRPLANVEQAWLLGETPTAAQRKALNNRGGVVSTLEAAIAADAAQARDAALYDYDDETQEEAIKAVLVILTMAVIEVALLAGPAFAVDARRQSRTLAMLAATGAQPRELRRVVLFGAALLGSIAAFVGLLAGLPVGRALHHLISNSHDIGQYVVPPWWLLLGYVVTGVASAVAAAFVPALLASKHDPVAVLTGRRSASRSVGWLSLPAAVILGALGLVLCWKGAAVSGDDLSVPVGGIFLVVAALCVIPWLLVLLAKASARLPFSARFAARDSLRHLTRTTPAIAAVMGVMSGVVALGIANASDMTESQQSQVSESPVALGFDAAVTHGNEIAAAAARLAPEATVRLGAAAKGKGWLDADIRSLNLYTGGRIVVADSAAGLTDNRTMQEAADRELATAGAVVLGPVPMEPTRESARLFASTDYSNQQRVAKADVLVLGREHDEGSPSQLVLSRALADRLELTTAPQFIDLGGSVDKAQAADLEEALGRIHPGVDVYVSSAVSEYRTLLIILGVVGGVMMLVGALTATVLALNDAKPDLATLSAVGAAQPVRRRIAAAYALVIGLMGTALGFLVGVPPGLAAATFLTRSYSGQMETTYVVPWSLVASLGIGVPLLIAALVAVTTRATLPMVDRRS